jgi:hypothetical protein
VLKPRVEIVSGNDAPAYMTRAYVYYINDREALEGSWRPGSYADAEAGLVRHRVSGEVRSHGLVGHQSDLEPYYITLTVSSSPMLIVVVDSINKFYAYRVFKYTMPLERILVPITFKVWQGEKPYRESEWTIVGEAYEAGGAEGDGE